MDRTLDDVRTSLAEQHAELWEIIDGLDPAGWDRPSLCAGWSVSDVLLHMAQTEEMAVASLEGRFDDADTTLATAAAEALTPEPSDDGDGESPELTVDDFADLAVQRERGAPGVKVAARWWTASRRLEELLGEADPHQRVTWVTGRLSVVSLATTRLAECWIHTGDIAEPLGVEQVPGERLRHVARLAWRTLPYAFALAGRELSGPVAFHLTGPDGDEWRFDPPEAAGSDAEAGEADRGDRADRGDGDDDGGGGADRGDRADGDDDGDAGITVVEGDGVELCLVAARRVDPADTGLRATGPDAGAVLDLVRTYA